jgi:hypothetical protein
MSLEGEKNQIIYPLLLQELIKMRCCEQKTTHVPFSSIIAKGGFVQKNGELVHIRTSSH